MQWIEIPLYRRLPYSRVVRRTPLISAYSLLGGFFFLAHKCSLLSPHAQRCWPLPNCCMVNPSSLAQSSVARFRDNMPNNHASLSNDTAKISCSLSSSSLTDKTSPKVRLLLRRVSIHS